jgi:hypothetical protein
LLDRYDPRWSDDRDRGDSRDIGRGSRGGGHSFDTRTHDARDVFTQDLDLPRGQEREMVREHNHTYELNRGESRALATAGAFRVVRGEDLRLCFDPPEDARGRRGDDLRHLRESGLVRTVPLDGRGREVVVLTRQGRDFLETNRLDRTREPRQTFYAGLRKPRELTHDAQVYRAFLRAEERLRASGAQVRRVVLDYDLKQEYQRFLQDGNRGRADSDGRPDRDEDEIEAWAREHDLPFFDESVHFPDARMEYEDRDGRERHEDIEVVTEHYRGAHAAGVARSGFTCYRVARLGGRGGGGRGRPFDPRVAEDLLP